MKSKLLLSLLFTFVFYLLSSQVPQGFNYQAIARGSDGKEIANTALQVQISILSDTSGFYFTGAGTYVWEEQQNVTTNSFGLFSLIIGKTPATKIQGSAASFSAINWTATPLYIGTKIYHLGSWKYLGTAKLGSVPYSMVADSSKALLKGSKLAVVSSNDLSTDALFEVKRKDGQTVFAVYPNAVNIYVPNGAKSGTKGGFAIGGFDEAKLGSQDYFRVTPDSVRVYIDKTPSVVKGATKGGFAIGGFDEAKGTVQDLLTVSNDSIRMYIDRNPAPGKGATKGGFAIGGFGEAKTEPSYFMNMTPKNYFIGESSGSRNKNGSYNSFMGYEAGKLNTDGNSNVFLGFSAGTANTIGNNNLFIGNNSGKSNIDGSRNIFLGENAGYSNRGPDISGLTGSDNVIIGTNAGINNTIGLMNIFIGSESGRSNVNGTRNIFLGDRAGYSNTGGVQWWQGSNNIFLGVSSGQSTTTGGNNIFIGTSSGALNTDGSMNVYIGPSSGYQSTAGVRNTFIGSNTGETNSTGSDNIFIGNQTGQMSTIGEYNTFLGSLSGWKNTAGNHNTFIGNSTGPNLISGKWNVFLGSMAGGNSSTGDANVYLGFYAGAQNSASGNIFIGYQAGSEEPNGNRLYIENSYRGKNEALIYGEFDNDILAFNASVGIGTSTPSAKLDVNGTVKIGTNGTAINKIIKVTGTLDLNNMAPGTSLLKTFSVPNAAVGSSVMISPSADLADGLEIAYARVSAAGTVSVKFRNVLTGSTIDPPNMDFYITVIE